MRKPSSGCALMTSVCTGTRVYAGIDMALHLVARLHSIYRARAVRRGIQYDPESPV